MLCMGCYWLEGIFVVIEQEVYFQEQNKRLIKGFQLIDYFDRKLQSCWYQVCQLYFEFFFFENLVLLVFIRVLFFFEVRLSGRKQLEVWGRVEGF